MKKMPNFLIIGAMKSGTTTLYNSLNQHPQVYMSRLKEPNFFAYNGTAKFAVTSLEDYQALFAGVTNQKAIGEASTTYLFSPTATANIKNYLPQAKLIAILRDPAQRAYSLYLMKYRANKLASSTHEKNLVDSFAKFVNQGQGGVLNQRYYGSIKRYLKKFKREQLKICIYQDLKKEPNLLLEDICQFLDIDTKISNNQVVQKSNLGGVPKNKLMYTFGENLCTTFNQTLLPFMPAKLLNPLRSIYTDMKTRNLAQAPPLPQEIRQQLINIYREDILHLQDFLQRDLSPWLKY